MHAHVHADVYLHMEEPTDDQAHCNKIVDRALCKTQETEAFPCSIDHTQTHTHTQSKV